MKNAAITIIFVLLCIVGIVFFIQHSEQADKSSDVTSGVEPSSRQEVIVTKPIQPTQNQTMNAQSKQLSKPSMMIDRNKMYTAAITTDKGTFVVQFHSKETPATVNNFIYLAKNHFYDNTIFHRVIKGFMIQGGDPTGTGMGGPGYRFDDEQFSGSYKRGVVAMANAGPNTNGSQFFIMHQDYNLPPNYVIFGEVIKGIDVIDAIANSPVQQNNQGEASQPVQPTHIQSIQIEEQ